MGNECKEHSFLHRVITWFLTGNYRTEAQEEVIVAVKLKNVFTLNYFLREGTEGGKQRCLVAGNKVIERWI